MWLMGLFIPLTILGIFIPLFYICWRARRSQREIESVFAPWKEKNIQTIYIRQTKHTPAYLYFQFLGQQQHIQTLNQGNVIIVQQPGTQQPQQIYGVQQVQQPGVVQGRVLQPAQFMQPMQIQQGQVIQQGVLQPTIVAPTVSSSSNVVPKI